MIYSILKGANNLLIYCNIYTKKSFVKFVFQMFTIPASLVTFANILTCVLGGMMGQYFGRKRSIILVAPVSILAFVCQSVAPSKALLFVGRFLVGVGAGLVAGPCTVNFYFIFLIFVLRPTISFLQSLLRSDMSWVH